MPEFGLGPLALAVIASLAAGLAAYWAIGVIGRQRAELAGGVEALATLRWREFAHLVLEALRRRGYIEEEMEPQPGEGGFDFILSRGGDRFLLACKHGTAYRLNDVTVRELSNNVRMQGASGGLIVTLGSVETLARELAPQHHIQLIDGPTLWPEVAPLVPPTMRGDVTGKASHQAGRRLGIAALGCVTLGLGIYLLTAVDAGYSPPSSETRVATPRAIAPTPAPGATAASSTIATTPAPPLSAADEAARRVAVAQKVAALPAISTAAWSTRSTLVLALRETTRKTSDPVEETCRILLQYDELRFIRLQIDPPPGSDAPVRWRQCPQL